MLEAKRIDALKSLGILDTKPEERFDRISRVAHQTFGVELAAVTFIDTDRQWFKSCVGVQVAERPRSDSFCTHTIEDDDVLIVEDALEDKRFADLTIVAGPPFVRFYAGVPLRVPDGSRVGTICLIGTSPRKLSDNEKQALKDLGRWAEDELRDDRARLERLFNESPVAMLDFDARNLVPEVESGSQQTFDLSTLLKLVNFNGPAASALDEDVDLSSGDVMTTLMKSPMGGLLSQIVTTIRSDGAMKPFPVALSGRDGSVRHFDVTWTLHRPIDRVGPVTLTVLMADATDRQTAHQNLELLLAAKDRLIASVSHELRTPLTAIMGCAHELDVLLREGDVDLAAEFSRMVSEQSRELSYIVEDLLVLARTDGGNHLVIIPEVLDMTVEANDLAHVLKIPIVVRGTNSCVVADRVRTRQVLRNLLTNAQRYGGPDIVVEIERVGDKVDVRVVDNGVGVPDGIAENIFEAYERLEASRTQPGSIGIGLAVARNLAEAMDGGVEYSRRKGKTVFTLQLPAVLESPPVLQPIHLPSAYAQAADAGRVR